MNKIITLILQVPQLIQINVVPVLMICYFKYLMEFVRPLIVKTMLKMELVVLIKEIHVLMRDNVKITII